MSSDISHIYGDDLQIDAKGGLAIAEDADLGIQRILRRLMTNPFGYVWSLDYGGGVAAFLGHPAAARRIESVVRSQMYLEASVAQVPPPKIRVSAQADGSVVVAIRYADASSGTAVALTLPVSANP